MKNLLDRYYNVLSKKIFFLKPFNTMNTYISQKHYTKDCTKSNRKLHFRTMKKELRSKNVQTSKMLCGSNIRWIMVGRLDNKCARRGRLVFLLPKYFPSKSFFFFTERYPPTDKVILRRHVHQVQGLFFHQGENHLVKI